MNTPTQNTPDAWLAIITVATPFIIAAVKYFAPRIPKKFLPAMTPLVGVALAYFSDAAGFSHASPWLGALAGAAGVAVRELYDQMKRESSGPADGSTLLLLCLLLALIAGPGCVSYRNTRAIDPKSSVVNETTTFRAPFLTKTVVEGLKSHVTDKTDKNGVHSYTRSLGLTNGSNEVDVEGLKAMESLLGSMLLKALAAGAPVPK